jgi:hypothetical protein
MTQNTRHYSASSISVQQPRVEPLPAPAINWREFRRWFLPLSALIVAAALYLVQSSYTTTSELDIARMAAERDTVQHRNVQLSAEIADLEKPSRIRDRAAALGMVDVNKTVRVTVQQSPAVSAGAPNGAPVPAPGGDDAPSLWQRLIGEIALRMAGTGQ